MTIKDNKLSVPEAAIESSAVNGTNETSETLPATDMTMKDQEAINIIQTIVNGINPLSDEPLAAKHLCLESDIQRALQTAIPALENQIKAEARRAKLPANAGTPWTNEEDQQLADAFDNGDSVALLIEKHQRTRGSINSRLLKLGKITG